MTFLACIRFGNAPTTLSLRPSYSADSSVSAAVRRVPTIAELTQSRSSPLCLATAVNAWRTGRSVRRIAASTSVVTRSGLSPNAIRAPPATYSSAALRLSRVRCRARGRARQRSPDQSSRLTLLKYDDRAGECPFRPLSAKVFAGPPLCARHTRSAHPLRSASLSMHRHASSSRCLVPSDSFRPTAGFDNRASSACSDRRGHRSSGSPISGRHFSSTVRASRLYRDGL